MAMGGATGGRVITFMPPIPPGTPTTPTVLTGALATAGTGKRSLSSEIQGFQKAPMADEMLPPLCLQRLATFFSKRRKQLV